MEQLWLFCLKIGQEIFGWFSNLNIFRKGAEQPYTEPNWSENQLTCNQIQKLSPPSGIQTFAIKLTYYQLSSDHIHLLDGLNCYQTHLLSILSCNQQFCYTIFDLLLIPIFANFISIYQQKNGIISHLEFSIFFASAWSWLVLMPQSNSVPNADFKKSIFDKKYQFLKKISIFEKNINFWKKNQFLKQKSIWNFFALLAPGYPWVPLNYQPMQSSRLYGTYLQNKTLY